MAVSVYIADEDGSNAVALTGAHEPYPVPVIRRRPITRTSEMRPGVLEAGRLVARLAGARWDDVTMAVAYLTADMADDLAAKVAGYPAEPVEVSVDGGTTKYLAAWADGDGLQLERWTSDPDRYRATIRLHILGPK